MRKNIYLFNLYHFFTGLWLFSALAVIYFQDVCHSYTLAILAYSMISISSSVLEIPLGVISDRLGRRPNLILSSIFLFLNMLLWALAGYYESVWMLFAGSFCRGIGVALHSGTEVAFLYETTGDLRCRKIFDKLYANAMSYGQMGLLISAICGMVVTYYLPLIYLVWMSVLPAFVKMFIIILVKEPKSNFDTELSPFQQIKKSINLIIKRKKLRNYTCMKVLTSGLILSIYRFEVLYYAQLIPLYLINVTRIIMHTTGYLSFMLSGMLRKIGFLQLLFYSNIGMALVRIVGLILNNTLTPFVASLSNLGYGIEVTAQAALMQKEYHKSLRATMNSLTELMCGLSIAIIGYLFGLLADWYSPQIAVWVATIVQISIAIGYKILFKTYLPTKNKPKLAIK